MKTITAITTKEAHKIFSDLSKQIKLETEKINIDDCLGRILAQDVYSYDFIPQFNKSAVDGYAIKSENLDTVPKTFKIDQYISISGGANEPIDTNNCVYVPTGAFVPYEYDSMVMIEHTVKNDDGTVTINKKVEKDNLIVFKGDDYKKDELAVKKNTLITPFTITTLAFFGVKEVEVYKKLNVSVISTGDELVPIDKKETLFNVRDINSYTISSLSKNLNCNIVNTYLVKDDLEQLRKTVLEASKNSDIVFLSGGSSVGLKDFTSLILSEISTIYIDGIYMKPGKPTIVSKNDTCTFIGLPGHPMSTAIVFKILVEPFIKQIFGLTKAEIPKKAILTTSCKPAYSKETYQMVKLRFEDNCLYADPIFTKSGFVSTMQQAEGYFIIPLDCEKMDAGAEVFVFEV